MILAGLVVILSFIATGFGAYFAGYLRKKGKNLATHEDIENLKDQVAAVTKTTEQIKAEISEGVWNRQKRWELKRDVVFDAVKNLAHVNQALMKLDATVRAKQRPDEASWTKFVDDTQDAWIQISADYDKAVGLVALVCETETYKAFSEFQITVTKIASSLVRKTDTEIFVKSQAELGQRWVAAMNAARKELGIDDGRDVVDGGGI